MDIDNISTNNIAINIPEHKCILLDGSFVANIFLYNINDAEISINVAVTLCRLYLNNNIVCLNCGILGHRRVDCKQPNMQTSNNHNKNNRAHSNKYKNFKAINTIIIKEKIAETIDIYKVIPPDYKKYEWRGYILDNDPENPGISTAEDPAKMFASAMQAPIAEIAATVTQTRIGNLYKDQKTLDALLAKKPEAKNQQFRFFESASSIRSQLICIAATLLRRQALVESNRYVLIDLAQTNKQLMGSEQGREVIQNPILEPSLSRIDVVGIKKLKGVTASVMTTISTTDIHPNCLKRKLKQRSLNKESRFLQLPVHHTKKKQEASGPNAVINLPNNTTQKLHDVVLAQGCFSTHTGFLMGQKTRHKNICIPGQSPDSGRIQRGVHLEHATSLFQALGTWIQDQHREIGNNAISIDNAFGNGHQLTRNVTKSPIFQSQGPTQRSEQNIERRPDDIEMLSELHWEGSSNS
ncbi:hypothetical protein BB561_004096 [Smittium simulii]|uniref:CCHC-type domain-containing protein n=1 Tax=Smittium simulii TaxID=133385 RepID=A0A2T9YHZ6_9FUNG|nr:hypothetical protein BB561_004096 [Smittium simulii]